MQPRNGVRRTGTELPKSRVRDEKQRGFCDCSDDSTTTRVQQSPSISPKKHHRPAVRFPLLGVMCNCQFHSLTLLHAARRTEFSLRTPLVRTTTTSMYMTIKSGQEETLRLKLKQHGLFHRRMCAIDLHSDLDSPGQDDCKMARIQTRMALRNRDILSIIAHERQLAERAN